VYEGPQSKERYFGDDGHGGGVSQRGVADGAKDAGLFDYIASVLFFDFFGCVFDGAWEFGYGESADWDGFQSGLGGGAECVGGASGICF
jgi:hypothetical protein